MRRILLFEQIARVGLNGFDTYVYRAMFNVFNRRNVTWCRVLCKAVAGGIAKDAMPSTGIDCSDNSI
jgi:hypothetical protein